jgi:hypothetical protein
VERARNSVSMAQRSLKEISHSMKELQDTCNQASVEVSNAIRIAESETARLECLGVCPTPHGRQPQQRRKTHAHYAVERVDEAEKLLLDVGDQAIEKNLVEKSSSYESAYQVPFFFFK